MIRPQKESRAFVKAGSDTTNISHAKSATLLQGSNQATQRSGELHSCRQLRPSEDWRPPARQRAKRNPWFPVGGQSVPDVVSIRTDAPGLIRTCCCPRRV